MGILVFDIKVSWLGKCFAQIYSTYMSFFLSCPRLQVGVILGGCLGHAVCTGGAVLAGALIARSCHLFFSSYHLVPLIICLHVDITIFESYFFLALFMFRFISIRKITFLGALVFLGFAIASIFIDPNEDGIDGIPDIQVATKYGRNIKFDNFIQ